MPDDSLITLTGLSQSYREGQRTHHVLRGLHLEVCRGEAVAILGRSGSGKSTLLNLIGGIDRPQHGQITVAGAELTSLSERRRTLFRRRHLGFVYQFFNLIPTLTSEENVRLPLELNGWGPDPSVSAARAMLAEVGLGQRATAFPDVLSGGEQQRVAIARALVHQPSLVLADEPTGNLDAETGEQVLALLDRLVRDAGRTLVVATHAPRIAELADRVLTLEDGLFRTGPAEAKL